MPRPKKIVPPLPPPSIDTGPSLDVKGACHWFGDISRPTLDRLIVVLNIPVHYVGKKREFKLSDLAKARQALERFKVPWSIRAENMRRRKMSLSNSQTDV